MKNIYSYADLLTYVREGRARFEQAEVEWFLRLQEVERTCMELIAAAGCETFGRFLKSNKLCEPTRYEAFCRGLARIDSKTAREMGTEAVIRLCDVREESKVPEVVQAVSAWREEHGGVFPTNETARHLVRQCDSRDEVPNAVRQKSARGHLEAELQKARADLRAEQAKSRKLEARVAELETELSRMRKRKAAHTQSYLDAKAPDT